jgi:2-methylisocitrate lyase-like PEP mutase family enzyme
LFPAADAAAAGIFCFWPTLSRTTTTAVGAVCAAVSKPVNFMVGINGKSFSLGELGAAGVRRISLATSLLSRDNDRLARRCMRSH